MTKEAAQRSIMRRMALVKVADLWSDTLNGYANGYAARPGPWPVMSAGTRVAANDALEKSKPPRPAQQVPAQRPAQRAPAQRPAPAPRPARPTPQPAATYDPPFWAPAASAAARGIGRAIEWGAYWPDHLKNWWRRNF